MPEAVLFEHVRTGAAARVLVDARNPGAHRVAPFLLGKFCEHLGHNIYHGMEAQILRNPTFAKWQFADGEDETVGGTRPLTDPAQVAARMRAQAAGLGVPDADALLNGYQDGLAYPWLRLGSVLVSPDVGPLGEHAQRFETAQAGAGLAQWAFLPLHRTSRYEFRLLVRAEQPVELTLALAASAEEPALGCTVVQAGTDWTLQTGTLELSAAAQAHAAKPWRLSLETGAPANVVVARLLLYPADHVNHADPDVIGMLREARLPLLRWPGGNFVSGYRWRDGVGPVDARPTRPNPAWDGLEYNLFGTAEAVAFCQAVGCELLICVNAGDGTPEEAAAWVEYCNGGSASPMGRLRTAHGHPRPFGIRYWEVGNELYGRWQVNWTTPGGNADRYLRFARAMRAADPSILLIACGEPSGPDMAWNRRLAETAGTELRCIADHVLTGGRVTAATDPDELFHAFMGYARELFVQYRSLRDLLKANGCAEPRLAITELQLFARWQGEAVPGARLSPTNMLNPATIGEALYFATFLFESIRLGDFVEMLTHSATVNHGGGLRKTRERVYANPVHHAHVMAAPLVGALPLPVRLECPTYHTGTKFHTIPELKDVPVLDVLAVRANDGGLTVMLVHRGARCGPVPIELECAGFAAASAAEVLMLAGETMFDANTLGEPERVVPRASQVQVNDGARLNLTLPPFSLTRVTLHPR